MKRFISIATAVICIITLTVQIFGVCSFADTSKCVCTKCSGSGSVNSSATCRTCAGIGKIESGTTQKKINCGACGGVGSSSVTTSVVCSACSGLGGLTYFKCICGNAWTTKTHNSATCALCNRRCQGNILTKCSTCNGKGSITKTVTKTCGFCNGKGYTTTTVTNYTTCTSCKGSGYVAYQINCDLCGGTGIHHTGGDATCSTQAKCTVCGTLYGNVNPDNHLNKETRNIVLATTDKEGYTGDIYCKDCDKLLEKGKTVPKGTHIHTGITHHPAVATTPFKNGNVEYWTCSDKVCDGIYYADSKCENVLKSITDSKAYVTVPVKSVGDYCNVRINIIPNEIITALQLEVTYDKSVLEFIKQDTNDYFGKSVLDTFDLKEIANVGDKVYFTFATTNIAKQWGNADEINKGLTAVNIKFKVIGNMTAESVKVRVSDSAGSLAKMFVPVAISVLYGNSVLNKGDINGDGEIKLADAMAVFKYVAKIETLDSDAFEAADCNSDGEVKLADAMAVFRYVAKVSDTVEF